MESQWIKELKVEVEKLKQVEKKMEEVERRAYVVLPKKREMGKQRDYVVR